MIEHGGNSSSLDYRSIREIASNAGAGATAGAIAATFVCPLDVIKTRLQVLGLPEAPASGQRGSVIITSLQNIVKNEGFRGMYRGLSPTIIALLPNWAVYFSVYGKLKEVLQSSDGKLSIGANMVAAAGAGAATSIATNPLWVVKTRLMTQGIRPDVVPYKSVMSAFSRICQEEGFRGLYSGILPSLAGVSHVAIQFPAYEKIKQYMANMDNTSVENLSTGNFAIASSIAKVIASVLTYPHEVIRAKLQEQGQMRNAETKYAGVIDCVKKVFKSEGAPGFYRGCATNLLRTTPSAVITFTTYEMMLRFFRQVVPPETNKSGDHKREEERKSLVNRRGDDEEEKDLGLRESQAQSKKINTSPIPLGSK
ncbi:hypothetical protein AALP_AA1G267200 [Arabis alpina]|uniref:Mitochondrial carrier protein n=1 Tax=Arabis alpina TaxID=50452 RepID=A0A087HQW7_ARAAL|nr:hypothetical protein AALP_AA1G267200 [Arabis alpina]